MDIFKLSACEIAGKVSSGVLSATEVTTAHLARIEAVNPAVNAVVQDVSAEALAAAAEIDRRIAAGEDCGPMAGVPVTIKVNVDQTGFATTNGLKLMQNVVATQDSPVVANLRAAGAILVGRTNTPAMSLRWFTKNDLHGQTLNPRNRDITPGGSSGGAAASVASGMVPLAHGTDIAGSIRYPAYACGLHGLRPTVGRVPAWNSSGPDRFIGAQLMAVSGPIARTMADLDLGFRVMARPDIRDPWHVPMPYDSGAFEKRAALTLAPDGMPVAEPVREALIATARRLEAEGWVVEEVDCPPMRAAAEVNATLWMAETGFAAASVLSEEGEADSLFVFDQMSKDAGSADLPSVMEALRRRVGLMREWDAFLDRYPLLICPVSGELPFDQQSDVASPESFAGVYEAQLTQRGLPALGMPALSLATGAADNRPLGVQLVARRWREDLLLRVGALLEASGHVPDVSDPFGI
ncbi:amidase family protein [Marinibacterium profundimaris]|uniref:Amidase n=1 Tax=Marinibacterium profundimaris TaxID=1679460 RepID=A0A225NMC7_9RHOB|nr:amidase family protein [Marinibacterium profundimaris]OWU75083.1 amidase [Marinibacterium profundimaris]